MTEGDPVDVWFGIGDGESKRLDGEFISEGLILITDQAFLESISRGPWPYECDRLPESRWVQYDDFAWSPPGEITLLEGQNTLRPRTIPPKSFGGKVRFHKVFDL